jgi:hypothetical protein
MYLKLFIYVKHSTCFGGLSVHHQELKTAHTATGICQTAAANCLLAAGSSNRLTYTITVYAVLSS